MGVVRRLQGGSKGVREKLTVYFLSLALGNCTTSLLHIFSLLSGFHRRVFARDDNIYSQSNRTFAFHMEHLLLVLTVFYLALSHRERIRIRYNVWKPSALCVRVETKSSTAFLPGQPTQTHLKFVCLQLGMCPYYGLPDENYCFSWAYFSF